MLGLNPAKSKCSWRRSGDRLSRGSKRRQNFGDLPLPNYSQTTASTVSAALCNGGGEALRWRSNGCRYSFRTRGFASIKNQTGDANTPLPKGIENVRNQNNVVIGAGTMGNGIAHVSAAIRFPHDPVRCQTGISRSRTEKRSPRISIVK